MAVVAWRALGRQEVFWVFWVAVALLPTLVVPLNLLVAERRLYLPLAGALGRRPGAGFVVPSGAARSARTASRSRSSRRTG